MQQLTAVDIQYLVEELQVLVGAKLQKVFQPGKKTLLVHFHITGKGKQFLRVEVPKAVYLTDYKEPSPTQPPGFCSFLRKRIQNTFVDEVRQRDFERIIEIVFRSKEEKYILIIELFSKGNVVLCDEKYKIINPLEIQKWADRTVRKGEEYKVPPRPYDLHKLTELQLTTAIRNTEKPSLVVCLATNLGLGGVYAEEVILKAGLDKNNLDLSAKQIKTLIKTIKDLIKQKSRPVMYKKDDKIVAIVSFPLQFYKQYEEEKVASLNKGFEKVLGTAIEEKVSVEVTAVEDKKVQKMDKVIAAQEKSLKKLHKQAEENQKVGGWLYNNYELVNGIIEKTKQGVKATKEEKKQIEKELQKEKVVKAVDWKKKKVILQVD